MNTMGSMNAMKAMNTVTAPLPPATVAPAKSSRPMIVLLAALFLLPVALGTGLFWSGWRPSSFSNHGELIQPPLPLPESGLLQMNGSAMPTTALLGQWLIVLPSSAPCDNACENTLQQLRQVHIALNKEQSRVQRVFLRLGEVAQAETPALEQLERGFPQLILASAPDDGTAEAWQRLFTAHKGAIFIVDPLGNVMMRYPDSGNMRGVLKDLERLLKYSWERQSNG